MKKMGLILGVFITILLFVSCGKENTNVSTINTPSAVTSNKEPSKEITPVTTTESIVTTKPNQTVIKTETTQIQTSPSQEENKNFYSIKQIYEVAKELSEGDVIEDIEFEGIYVKAITETNDKLMLFVDNDSYINVRVVGGFDSFLKNRYLNCKYHVYGDICNKNGVIEVKYNLLENVTSKEETVDYSKITLYMNSIKEVYDQMDDIVLNNKKTGVGKIVTFKGVVLATDRSDSNSKATFYDNNHIITVINSKKICDAVNDIMNEYTITGIISILNGQPAILLLDIKDTEETITINYENVVEVKPSYFSKWYHVGDKINDPSYLDFAILYRVVGYINIDTGRNGLYFGMTDNENDTLNDVGIKTSVKGFYLMNYQNQQKIDSFNEKIITAYENSSKVSLYASMYQFDTQNHAWKMFIVDSMIS